MLPDGPASSRRRQHLTAGTFGGMPAGAGPGDNPPECAAAQVSGTAGSRTSDTYSAHPGGQRSRHIQIEPSWRALSSVSADRAVRWSLLDRLTSPGSGAACPPGAGRGLRARVWRVICALLVVPVMIALMCGAPVTGTEVEMAQKVTVALEDDLDGGPADETVRFGLGGAEYEIDLSAKNASAFRAQMAPFVEHARKAGRQPAGRPARTAAGRQRGREIRVWAREHGLAVSDRGRIPASVVERYQAMAKRR